MSTTKKILTIWSVYLLLSLLSLTLPHHFVDKMAWVNTSVQVLLFIVCLYIAKNSFHQNKPIFINFAILFFFTFLSFSNMFVGTIFWKDSPYSEITYHAYVGMMGYYFMLAVCLLYLSFDYFFHKLKTVKKYALTLLITLAIFLPLFSPYITEPLSLYGAEEYTKYIQLKTSYVNLQKESGKEPSNAELQQAVLNGSAAVSLTDTEVEHLRVYLADGAETILFWKPLYVNFIYVNLFLVFVLALFVIHKYWNDKPHPAYLEKIAILFILWCSFDVFHNLVFITTNSLELYRTLFTISQYLSIFTILLLVYIFSIRLRFVLSASGKYYEEELLIHPEGITRWRDEIDSLVVNYFFSSKKLFGRLLTTTRRP